MPPWSDVRALAESLAQSDETITFLDVLPLQRSAQSLMHMPWPTLNAIIELRACAQLTLGAQEVVSDVLRGYQMRVAQERKLGQVLLTQAHHGKTVRIAVGQGALVQLPVRRGQQWHFNWRGLDTATASPTLEFTVAADLGSKHQRTTIVGHVPGAFELEGKLAVLSKLNAFGQGIKNLGTAAKKTASYRLIVVVEELPQQP